MGKLKDALNAVVRERESAFEALSTAYDRERAINLEEKSRFREKWVLLDEVYTQQQMSLHAMVEQSGMRNLLSLAATSLNGTSNEQTFLTKEGVEIKNYYEFSRYLNDPQKREDVHNSNRSSRKTGDGFLYKPPDADILDLRLRIVLTWGEGSKEEPTLTGRYRSHWSKHIEVIVHHSGNITLLDGRRWVGKHIIPYAHWATHPNTIEDQLHKSIFKHPKEEFESGRIPEWSGH